MIQDPPSNEAEIETLEDPSSVDKLRNWGRITIVILITILLLGDIGMYSLYQAQKARVEILDHRVERLDKALHDILASQDNAEKIEKIEQRVNALGSSVGAMKTTLEEEASVIVVPSESSKKSKKR